MDEEGWRDVLCRFQVPAETMNRWPPASGRASAFACAYATIKSDERTLVSIERARLPDLTGKETLTVSDIDPVPLLLSQFIRIRDLSLGNREEQSDRGVERRRGLDLLEDRSEDERRVERDEREVRLLFGHELVRGSLGERLGGVVLVCG